MYTVYVFGGGYRNKNASKYSTVISQECTLIEGIQDSLLLSERSVQELMTLCLWPSMHVKYFGNAYALYLDFIQMDILQKDELFFMNNEEGSHWTLLVNNLHLI